MTCPHAASGCNYPEGDCPGTCLVAKQHYLTIVYRITEPRQARALLEHAEWSAASHTHAIHERDRVQAQRDELLEALTLVMRMDVKGHELQDRLQFSTAGRKILDRAVAAIAKATKEGA